MCMLEGVVGGRLLVRAVGVEEEAVVLLFEACPVGEGVEVLGDPGCVAGFEGGRGLGGPAGVRGGPTGGASAAGAAAAGVA